MVTIYGVYRSRASRPLWLLHEIGMPFDHVAVIQAYRLPNPTAADAPINTASPAYRAVNPQGQIPGMTDGTLTLTESMAITMYLAAKYGGPLGAQDEAETALMMQWALHAASAVETPALEMLLAQRDSAGTPQGEATIAVAAEKLRRPFERLERHLGRHPYLVGDRFTVADINGAECVRYAQGNVALMAAHPALSDWLRRCQSRDGFKAMWTRRMSEAE
jgi:glutathione S-transferase